MKVKQKITRTEESVVDVEFPVYVQHDVGDEHTYVVTYRYELQNSRIPTFLVSQITRSDRQFEFTQGQWRSVDSDLAANRVSAATWNEEVEAFAKWADESLKKMRAHNSDEGVNHG